MLQTKQKQAERKRNMRAEKANIDGRSVGRTGRPLTNEISKKVVHLHMQGQTISKQTK